MRKLKHFLISLLVFLGIAFIFPDSTFFALLAALIVNFVSSDYSDNQNLVDLASPKRFLYKRKIKGIFKLHEDISTLSAKSRKFSDIFSTNKIFIDEEFIKSLDTIESCGFILAIQSDHHCFNFDSRLNNYHFKQLAGKAVKYPSYRKLLIKESLNKVGKIQDKYVEDLSLNANFVIGDDLKKTSDFEFNKKSRKASMTN